MLQTASGESLSNLKEALVELTLGWSPVCIWVLFTEIMGELILELNILHTYDAFMDLGRHMLQLDQEEVSLWIPLGTASVFLPCGGQQPCDSVMV
jgi:hypothetical protein